MEVLVDFGDFYTHPDGVGVERFGIGVIPFVGFVWRLVEVEYDG